MVWLETLTGRGGHRTPVPERSSFRSVKKPPVVVKPIPKLIEYMGYSSTM